ncbi:DUF3073 domain-containing protein [Aestuariimicrobium kwangyangense]|uniref:DUF3073 domain-containing protein n=2 Tax=Aestuariimicrobium TaxID=396388 RepID=UPI003CCC0860
MVAGGARHGRPARHSLGAESLWMGQVAPLPLHSRQLTHISAGTPARDTARGSTHMGRGRAKAKQTKVARDLKYRSVDTDFASLERELRSDSPDDSRFVDLDDDQYADLAAQYVDGEDDDPDGR